MPDALTSPALIERFRALDAFLLAHRGLWQPRPFTQLTLPWEREHPTLAGWLRRRSLDEAERDQRHPESLDAPEPFASLARQSRLLAELPALPAQPLERPASRALRDIPGRKLAQIEAFAACVGRPAATPHWLDWCAGKAHLGRLLARNGDRLTALEYDAALVEAGQALSDRRRLEAQHRCVDVLAEPSQPLLAPDQLPVALHACGDLHVRLLQQATAAGVEQLAVAPCCYNRIATPAYQPLSQAAQTSALRLSRDDLGLPLTETVTAGRRVRQQRDQSMAWRLAFDLLQRELRGSDDYLPTPSLAVAWLHKPFADYCRDLAALKRLPAPPERDWPALEARGWARLAAVRNLELVRALFRRPLEVWLLLDRALYLEEHGYAASLGTFCPTDLTPRNALLLAHRHAATKP